MEAEKQLIVASQQLAAALSGKKANIDTSAIDAGIAKISELQRKIGEIKPVAVKTDTTQIDQAETKIETLKTLTINGVTLEVKSDTTPADFGIKKVISENQGKQVVIKVNPEWKAAQAKIEAAKKGEERKPIKVKVDANTAPAKTKIAQIEKPTASTHTVKANASQAESVINRLKQPTSSVHTVYVRTVETHATGGLVGEYAQRFASGGRVPGYDPNDRDTVFARLTAGEYVIPRRSVDYYGLGLLERLRKMQLPRFAEGGAVSGVGSSSATAPLQPVNIHIGDRQFPLMGDREIVAAIQRYFEREGGM